MKNYFKKGLAFVLACMLICGEFLPASALSSVPETALAAAVLPADEESVIGENLEDVDDPAPEAAPSESEEAVLETDEAEGKQYAEPALLSGEESEEAVPTEFSALDSKASTLTFESGIEAYDALKERFPGMPEKEKLGIDVTYELENPGEDGTANVGMKGTLLYAEGFKGYSKWKEDQEGYYTILKLTAPEAVFDTGKIPLNTVVAKITTGDVGTAQQKEFTLGDFEDGLFLVRRIETGMQFTVKVDWDGPDLEEYEPQIYNIWARKDGVNQVKPGASRLEVSNGLATYGLYDTLKAEYAGLPAEEKLGGRYFKWSVWDDGMVLPAPADATLLYAENFTGFNESNPEEQEGYYTVLRFDIPEGVTPAEDQPILWTKSTADNVEEDFIKADFKDTGGSLVMVKRVVEGEKFAVTVDWDGEAGLEYLPTTYTVDFGYLKLRQQESELTIANGIEEYDAVKAGYADLPAKEKLGKDLEWQTGKDGTVKAEGTLLYAEGFTGFSESDKEEQEGYYTILRFDMPKGVTSTADTVVVTMNSERAASKKEWKAEKFADGSLTIVIRVNSTDEVYTVTADWDGEAGKEYTPTTYTLDFSGLTLRKGIPSAVEDIVRLTENEYEMFLGKGGIFGTSPEYEAVTVDSFGYAPGDLESQTEDYAADVKTKGSLYALDFDESSSAEKEQSGYYMLFRMILTDGQKALLQKANGTVLTAPGRDKGYTYEEIRSEVDAGYVELVIPVADSEDKTAEDFEVKLDFDGAESDIYGEVTYRFDMSSVALWKTAPSRLESPVTVISGENWTEYTGSGGAFADGPSYDHVKLDGGDGSFEIPEPADGEAAISLNGTLKKAISFKSYNQSNPDEQEGFYAALRIPFSIESIKAMTAAEKKPDHGAFVTTGSSKFETVASLGLKDGRYFDLIQWIDPETKQFTVTVDWDGSGTNYDPVKYIFDCSGVTFDDSDMYGTMECVDEDFYKKTGIAEIQNSKVRISPEAGSGIKTATFSGMIPFTEKVDAALGYQEEEQSGYFAGVKISVPAELGTLKDDDSVVITYGNGAESPYTTWREVKSGDNFMYQIYRVDDPKKPLDIKIKWLGKYEDNYRIAFAPYTTWAPDTTVYAAPKSVKLISPAATMYVGDMQRLDAMITKDRVNDSVKLLYVQKGPDSPDSPVWVSPDGELRACRPGKETILVYALLKDDYDFENSKTVVGTTNKKGVFTPKVYATLNVTVKDVKAPTKLKSVPISGGDIALQVTWTGNITAADQKGTWEAYVMPADTKNPDTGRVYKVGELDALEQEKLLERDGISELFVEQEANIATYIEGNNGESLKPNTKYTVYVRSVIEASPTIGYPYAASRKGTLLSVTTSRVLPTGVSVNLYSGTAATADRNFTVGQKNIKMAAAFSGAEYEAAAVKSRASLTCTYTSSDPKVVSISNKGVLTFKNVGTATIAVTVKSGAAILWDVGSTKIEITVTQDADAYKMTARSTTLTVGDLVAPYDLMKFNYNLEEDMKDDIRIIGPAKAADQALFDKSFKKESDDEGNEYWRAVSPTSKAIKVNITWDGKDLTKPKTAVATLQVKELAKPGAPKLYKNGSEATTHDRLVFSFVPSTSKNVQYYEVTLKNAKKVVVAAKTLAVSEWKEDEERALADGRYVQVGKTREIASCFEGLLENSAYYIEVYACYEGETSRIAVSGALKTTKRVAAAENATGSTLERFGALPVSMVDPEDKQVKETENGYSIKTGDIIVVSAKLDDPLVRALESDSLTWTVTDKKVVSLKANKSTFDATITALKTGTTTITVKSKTTGKVYGTFVVSVDVYGNLN